MATLLYEHFLNLLPLGIPVLRDTELCHRVFLYPEP